MSKGDLDRIEVVSLNADMIRQRLDEHLRLTFVSTFWVILIAVPLGIALTRRWARRFSPFVLGIASVGQAVSQQVEGLRLVVVDRAVDDLRRQYPLGQVVVAGETDPGGGREHPGGEQRFGHPFRVAAVPPRAFGAPRLRAQVGLDLSRGAGPELENCVWV